MKKSRYTLNFSELDNTYAWTTNDTHWLLSLFGTSVGAGILFLPINLGIGGFWPLVTMAILTYPMMYLAHRGLARFILSSEIKNADFTDIVEEHFGAKVGRTISLLYFLSIFPILLIYGVGITNTVDSFMINQADMEPLPRTLLSGVLVLSLIAIMMAGEKVILRAFAIMVYPLIAILAFLSFYLISDWSVPVMDSPEPSSFVNTIWLAIPVMIFSFSHAASLSSFVNVQRRHYGASADAKSELILRRTNIMLTVFVLLFVFSSVLALSPEQLAEAKSHNISVLSYLANATNNPFIATLSPLVAFVAITSSFFGHFLGARESLNGLITKHSKIPKQRVDNISVVMLFVSIWSVAIMNPNILSMMEALSGPIIAMILFIMPMLAVFKVKALKQYRRKVSTHFVLITGVTAVSALVFRLLG